MRQGSKTMTAIDRTIYRRMKRSYAIKELIEAYTPTEEERRFVNTMTRRAEPIEPHALDQTVSVSGLFPGTQ
jgi:hypothetical protein